MFFRCYEVNANPTTLTEGGNKNGLEITVLDRRYHRAEAINEVMRGAYEEIRQISRLSLIKESRVMCWILSTITNRGLKKNISNNQC